MKKPLLIVLLTCISSLVFAQADSTDNTPNKTQHVHAHIFTLKQNASNYFDEGRYYPALNAYQELDSLRPNDPSNIYYIGVCLLMLEKPHAIEYLERCLENESIYSNSLHLYAGIAYHLDHQFNKAIKQFQIYKEHVYKLGSNRKTLKVIHDINKRIENCHTGVELFRDTAGFIIHNLKGDINSKYPEYAPLISADGNTLVFTSERPNELTHHRDKYDGTFDEHIYISHKDSNGNWQQPEVLPGEVNQALEDDAVYISPNAKKMIIYRYGKEHLVGINSGELFFAEKAEDGSWGHLEKLPDQVNAGTRETGATLSSDGQDIYFTSNRHGGLGGNDLYVTHKQADGSWSKAENLGNKINTTFDELSPYLHPDGKSLYFCSNGHPSIGGFDIYVSKLDEKTNSWGEPINLGHPVNSAHDDLYFSVSPDHKKIYISSIRKDSKGSRDIYWVTLKNEQAKLVVWKGFITDSITNKPIQAKITVKDLETNELIGTYNSSRDEGKYVIIFNRGKHYDIDIQAEGYKICLESLDNKELKEYTELHKHITLCPEETSKKKKKKKKKKKGKNKS